MRTLSAQEIRAWGIARTITVSGGRSRKAVLLPEVYAHQAEALGMACAQLGVKPGRGSRHQLQLLGYHVVEVYVRTPTELPRHPDLEPPRRDPGRRRSRQRAPP